MESAEVSELKAKLAIATDRLRKSEERATAGQLALEVMHEIRNPLEALGHLNYLALKCADQSVKVREYLTRAEEQLATLNRIASQSLGFARSLSSPRPIDLVTVAEAALRIHQRTIQEKECAW